MPDMLVRLSLSHDRMFTYWPPKFDTSST
jgi:hypothetical protein